MVTEETYKVRFDAKGYSQIPDVDYQETFAPILHAYEFCANVVTTRSAKLDGDPSNGLI